MGARATPLNARAGAAGAAAAQAAGCLPLPRRAGGRRHPPSAQYRRYGLPMELLMYSDLTFCQFFFSRDTRKLMDICAGEEVSVWGGRGQSCEAQRHAAGAEAGTTSAKAGRGQAWARPRAFFPRPTGHQHPAPSPQRRALPRRTWMLT